MSEYRDAYNFQVQNAQRRSQSLLSQQAGRLMADGDTTGARDVLYRGGELQAGGQLDERLSAQRKAKVEASARWSMGLGRMLEDPRFADNPMAAWQAAASYAPKLGLDPQEIEADRQLFERDPRAYAAMLHEKAQEEIRVMQQGPYVRGINTRTGATAWENNFPQDSQDRKLPQGYEIGPNGQPTIADWYVQGEQRKAGARRAPASAGGGGRGGGSSGGARRQPWND